MADTEEYFPRGGKKPTAIFKKPNFLGASDGGEKKKKKPRKRTEGDDGYLSDEGTQEIDQAYKNCAVGLSYQTIKQGVLVLGRVRQIHETKMIVMLPCRLIGNVMACHVSEPYNKVLEAYVNDEVEKVREMSAMFKPGQYIAVKVLEVQGKSLMLSTMPQHINAGKSHADIVKGAIFQAAVSSIEDHGYVMDIGVPNTKVFLPKKATNPDIELDVGSITWCAIKSSTPSAESCIVSVTNSQGAVQSSVLKKKQNTLLPGTTVEFTVDTPLDNGIEGTIFGDTTCYIQRQHADKVKGKKPALGQKIRARVLYVMPTRNTPFLTMKNVFETSIPDLAQEQTLNEGDIIEEATVIKLAGRSIVFKLPGGCAGAMSVRRLQLDEDLSDEQVVAKSYPIGSRHKVRVLCYNLSDYTYSVSDEPALLCEQYFSLAQLAVGQLVSATVRAVGDAQLELDVGRVKGFVPHTHISEAGVYIDSKKARVSNLPHKKYKVGQAVKARVLSLDRAAQRLVLTLKPSLLAPELAVLQDYREAEVGKAYVGVVRLIRDYLLVSFFGDVAALVPRQFVSKDLTENLADAFHLGQIVTCTILNVKPEEKKMTGSLTTTPFIFDENRKSKRKHKQETDKTTEVPKKKRKNSEETDEEQTNDAEEQEEDSEEEVEVKKTKKGKKKEVKEDSDSETEAQEKSKQTKKKRNDSEKSDTTEETSGNNKKKKKKELQKKVNDIDKTIEDKGKQSKKKRKDSDKSETTEETTEQIKKKKRAKLLEDLGVNLYESATEGKKKKEKAEVKSEESDAIETDFNDEEDILTPTEQGLLDDSDCTTVKDYKKRTVALIKAIKVREKRLGVVEKKISNIEEKGLTSKNKKYHTAMQTEKSLIQQRIAKLGEALQSAQEKLNKLGSEKKDDYKEEQKKRKKEKALEKKKAKKEQKIDKVTENIETKKESKASLKQKMKDIKVVTSLEPALEVPSAKDFWSDDVVVPRKVQEEESSSSEDEVQEEPKKKRKKLSVAEKLHKLRSEEERVRALEQAASAGLAPASLDQFERALLARPADSQLWIGYMAFHLQATELDKARAVARKALHTIPFREEADRRNVWLALLNLEHRFGTKESQQKTLEDALQMNDPYTVHSKLLDILVETGKHQELTSLADLMVKKYKRQPECYAAAGGACFRLELVDKARQIMQKGIAVLEKKQHVSLLVQFALLERSHGSRERAEALFEQVLTVYPQRVDVACVYVDMLMKAGDVDNVRQVLERLTSQKMPARKMKVLYKKWIEIEEKIGGDSRAEEIRQRAVQFIENAKF